MHERILAVHDGPVPCDVICRVEERMRIDPGIDPVVEIVLQRIDVAV